MSGELVAMKQRQEEMDRMAGELVAMKQRQEEMDNMAAEMHQMKEMMKSLRPSASTTSSLADPQLNMNRNASNFPTQPTATPTSANLTLAGNLSDEGVGHDLGQQGAAGAGHLQSLHQDVSDHSSYCPGQGSLQWTYNE